MVIGNGDLASAIPDKEGITFFASGVSNSKETRESEFRREINLLLEQDKHRHIVYFSSLGVFDKKTPYFLHKKYMEELVKTFNSYTIVRLGNITWGTNPNTLINNMKLRIKNGETLEIRNEYRHLVSKEEFLYWINLIPMWNCEINIPGRMMKVSEVVKEFVL